MSLPVTAFSKGMRLIAQMRRLPQRVSALERAVRELIDIHKGHRLVLDQLTLPSASLWQGQPPLLADRGPGARVFETGGLCRQDCFEQPYFSFWTARLHEGLRYHRKLWEFVFIAQAVWERGLCSPGRRGLGFGVGQERLTALFASMGVAVTATDLEGDGRVEAGWQATRQHAGGKDALRCIAVCPDDLFDRNVEFRVCDMNAVPDDLVGYDFCWSACALEHLGSIEKGLAFIERSIDCLAPNGWAVHTTEFNISSNDETVDDAGTVLFRRRDIDVLIQRLRSQGHWVAEMDWSTGDRPVEQYLDLPPYRHNPHLTTAIEGFATTSVGIIVRKGQPAAS